MSDILADIRVQILYPGLLLWAAFNLIDSSSSPIWLGTNFARG